MMHGFTDSDHLRNVQYRDASNLQARGNLHSRFGTNPVPWMHWYFAHLRLPSEARVLEVGCGPATLWVQNADRIPAGWHITLTDLSPGMIEEARANLASLERDFTFAEVDVQELPFPDESYDAVIANHMLYHLPDLKLGLSQIARVLKPGGTLFAATNGNDHMVELRRIAHEIYDGISTERILGFGLDNGAELLSPYFASTRLERYDNSLSVTDAQALKDYVGSMDMALSIGPQALQAIYHRIDDLMARDGVIEIRTRAGIFIATKAH